MSTPTPPLPPLELLIDGHFVSAGEGKRRATRNPATGEVIAEVAEGTAGDAARAVRAARRAFDEGPWPRSGHRERAALLWRVAELVERESETLAALETLDTGKPLAESRDDMAQIAAVFRYYGARIATQAGAVNPVPAEALSLTLYEPVGVVAMMIPWNYPLLQASWKVAPALAAGCTFVLKPSELTPLTALKLGELLLEAGLPAGVANVVLGSGSEVGAALVASEAVDMVSFTGGIDTGRRIAAAAATTVKKVALELGGKNPNIVLADADFEAALDHALNAVFYHAGQVCSAGARLLVERSLHDRFLEALVDRTRRVVLGYGWEDATEMGPLISEEHRHKVESFISRASEEGACLCLGGARPAGEKFARGYFLEPTVLSEVSPTMQLAREEVFGPVLGVERFATPDEALRLANATPTGLAAAVWSQDVAKAVKLARRLRFGTVWVNAFHPYYPEAPWGGTKQSGVGRELGEAGLREFQEEKHLYVNLDVKATNAFGKGRP